MALKVREDRYGVTTGADSRHLVRASKILCEITETVIARNKSVVGINAFAHEAGIPLASLNVIASPLQEMRDIFDLMPTDTDEQIPPALMSATEYAKWLERTKLS